MIKSQLPIGHPLLKDNIAYTMWTKEGDKSCAKGPMIQKEVEDDESGSLEIDLEEEARELAY